MDQNIKLLNKIKAGDILIIPTEHHTHWVVYVGDGRIIHIRETKNFDPSGVPANVVISEESLLSVAQGYVAYRDFADLRPSSRSMVVKRAKSKLGANQHNKEMFKSCGDFIFWCRYGHKEFQKSSHQIIESEANRNGRKHIECNNFNVIQKLVPGDIVKISRSFYSHWGIYVGDSKIVHVTGYRTGDSFAPSGVPFSSISEPGEVKVVEESLLEVINGDVVEIGNDRSSFWRSRPLSNNTIVRRARSKIGTIEYHTMYKNCEHFVNWCRYDVEESSQTQTVMAGVTAGSGLVGFLIGGPIGALAAASLSAYQLYKHAKKNQNEG